MVNLNTWLRTFLLVQYHALQKQDSPPSTLITGCKTKNREKRRPTPHCHHSEDEGGLGPQEESELSLIARKLVNINTKLASHASPPDVEKTSARIRRTPTTPTTGKLHMADCTVHNEVTWPHEVMFTAEGKPAVYVELSVMAFVREYLIVMDSQTQNIKTLMESHLQDLMEDREAYGWLVVRNFHSTWLQYIEMGRVLWDDHATKLRLRRTLVWHCLVSPKQRSSPNPQPKSQET